MSGRSETVRLKSCWRWKHLWFGYRLARDTTAAWCELDLRYYGILLEFGLCIEKGEGKVDACTCYGLDDLWHHVEVESRNACFRKRSLRRFDFCWEEVCKCWQRPWDVEVELCGDESKLKAIADLDQKVMDTDRMADATLERAPKRRKS